MCLAPPHRHPPAVIRRHTSRCRDNLMIAACVLDMLDSEEEEKSPRGRLLGSKNIRRTRKKVEHIWSELGCYARKAWRMSMDAFDTLHDLIQPELEEQFNIGERARGVCPNGEISTKLRLSAAIRFFAGASIYDLILTHGMGKQSIHDSVYSVVNAVNGNKSLAFNANDAGFPSHAEQEKIAAGFRLKCGADFCKIMLAVDGMLIWTIEPSKADCIFLNIGQRLFHCYRKDKYGWLLMAGCDDETQVRWADIKHTSSTSDYLAWTSSDVGIELLNDDRDLILQDYVIAGDNTFVENMTMTTPVPGMQYLKWNMPTTSTFLRFVSQLNGHLVFWYIVGEF